jgi:hypothetical protein
VFIITEIGYTYAIGIQTGISKYLNGHLIYWEICLKKFRYCLYGLAELKNNNKEGDVKEWIGEIPTSLGIL